MTKTSCAVCGSSGSDLIYSLPCGILDGSHLYPEMRLAACTACGHVFNVLTPDEISGLAAYYNDEYAPANLQSVVKDGDLPGSTGAFTLGRYAAMYELLEPHLNTDAAILDVGCAVGGFLDFLKEKGVRALYGVDMTETYVARAREKRYTVERGDAASLPFPDAQFDALIIEQVMEHLTDPGLAFREAARVLKPGGTLCVGVPDSARYAEFYFFDFFWLLMREHIQHFDIRGLARLAALHGFELVESRHNRHPIMGDTMVMPNLSATFRHRGKALSVLEDEAAEPLASRMKEYLALETPRLEKKQLHFRNIAESRRPVYVWGIGREFLYLYEAAGLKRCMLAGCIDMNPFKQQTVTIAGKRIEPPEILARASRDAVLIVAARAHEEAILKSARQIGFAGEIAPLG